MSGKKFHLDLSGRPLDGYRTEEVAKDLARLFRIPRKRARNLLRGSPSRIKRELDKEKAVHLMGKIIACGAQCEISPSKNRDDAGQLIEAGIELSEKLELEIDQSEMELELPSVAAETASQGDALCDDQSQPVQPELPADKVASAVFSVDKEGGVDREVQYERPGTAEGDAAGKSGTGGRGRQRVLVFAAVAVVLLGVAIWAGLKFQSGPSPMPQKEVPGETPIQKNAPETVPEMAKTRQRLELLSRSVKIWMIQYGAGFDPSQVTMERMQQDLGISPEGMEDGWGTRFQYTTAAEIYTITSAGPDGIFASEDDIKTEKSAR